MRSALGTVMLAEAISQETGLAELRTKKHGGAFDDEGYAWALRIYGHHAELALCAANKDACAYEYLADLIHGGQWLPAVAYLERNTPRIDRVATAVHEAEESHCAPVAAAIAGRERPTQLSWAALLRISALKRAGRADLAASAQTDLQRRHPRWQDSARERYYEGFAPAEHRFFHHDRPRTLRDAMETER